MKKAFTLAEIMIVLTIIGVLTAILLPIANHSRPDWLIRIPIFLMAIWE